MFHEMIFMRKRVWGGAGNYLNQLDLARVYHEVTYLLYELLSGLVTMLLLIFGFVYSVFEGIFMDPRPLLALDVALTVEFM
jgi:hypothetical protein